jgi:hypothetical protein
MACFKPNNILQNKAYMYACMHVCMYASGMWATTWHTFEKKSIMAVLALTAATCNMSPC